MAAEYTVMNNDFSKYDNNKFLTLTKIDRNNTHYYNDCRCPRCGGDGYIRGYAHVEGGICFACGGSGQGNAKVIVRTREYQDLLAHRRLEKARKTASARNATYLNKQGFNAQGETWIVLGNTYEIKESLKEAGARFNRAFGWHFDKEVTEFPVVKVSINDSIKVWDDKTDTIGKYQEDGTLFFINEEFIMDHIKGLNDSYKASTMPETAWYGEVGQKVCIPVQLVRVGYFDTVYGTTAVYTFEDTEGHQLVWKTGTRLNAEVGSNLSIKGTVKAHSTYKGVKQTELTRCKAI